MAHREGLLRSPPRAVPRALAALALLCGSAAGKPPALDPVALVRRVETQYRGRTSHAVGRMTVVTEAWRRSLTLEMWGEGREKFLVKVRAPKKEEGTATLKIGDEIWNYLPKIDRLIKVPSSLLGEAWMGSHLTNDDLVKEDKVEELYDLSVASATAAEAWIEARPKPGSAVVWGRILYQIDRAREIPVSADYYDEAGARVRTLRFDRVERVAGRWVPLRLRVEPADEPGRYTEIDHTRLEMDAPLPRGIFTLEALR